MGFCLTTKDYVEYLKQAYARIHAAGDYITALDAATGDGDHWANINMGFEKLMEAADELAEMDLYSALKEIGMIMMRVIGGSGGVLYGSAYIEAAKALKGQEVMGSQQVCEILEAMMKGIMIRGKAEPGMKTMLDTLYPAVCCYKECLANGVAEEETLKKVRAAALQGAESTRELPAVKGRAFYQANCGVGHLDPGAVTMAYQIEALMDYILSK